MFSTNYNYQYIDWAHDPIPGEEFEHLGNLVSHIIRPTITIGLSDYLNINYQQTIGVRSMDWMGEGDSYHHRDENSLSDFVNALGNAYGDASINLKYLVNIGAGEGYHSVGCLNSGICQYCISFEMLEENRNSIRKNFIENDIKKNFLILPKAEIGFLNLLREKIKFDNTLFLFDIEGDEFKLLDHSVLNEMKTSRMIIEFHHFYSDDISRKKLVENIQEFFDIKWIKNQSRSFSEYNILNKFSDDEKWLMMSESRPQTMQWLICEPKK